MKCFVWYFSIKFDSVHRFMDFQVIFRSLLKFSSLKVKSSFYLWHSGKFSTSSGWSLATVATIDRCKFQYFLVLNKARHDVSCITMRDYRHIRRWNQFAIVIQMLKGSFLINIYSTARKMSFGTIVKMMM